MAAGSSQMAAPLAGAALALPGLECSERYMSEVSCGNHTFLFSRHDTRGDHKTYETLVRVERTDARAMRGGEPTRARRYSSPTVALPSSFLMSHNAAFVCVGTKLVAYGGMHHLPTSEDWLGNDIGIVRREASAHRLPLAWTAATPVLSGNKASTGCLDRLNEPCEYDGKLSAVRWKGGTLLFARSNASPEGGHRHVQVARSADGVGGWSRFAQLRIANVTQGEWELYYLAVRRVEARGGPMLLGLFPGVVNGVGGIYATTSTCRDGIEWSRPRKLLPSVHAGHGRTADAPVDGGLSWSLAPPGAGPGVSPRRAALSLRVAVQYAVDLRDYAAVKSPSFNSDCQVRSRVCAYEVPAWRLMQTPPPAGGPSARRWPPRGRGKGRGDALRGAARSARGGSRIGGGAPAHGYSMALLAAPAGGGRQK